MSAHHGMIDLDNHAESIRGLSVRASQIESIAVRWSVIYKEATTVVYLISGRRFELKGDLRGALVEAMGQA